MRAWAEAIGARRRPVTLFGPAALQGQIEATNAFLASCGYLSEDASVYFSPNRTHCFYPLVLRRSEAGLLDMLVPVFRVGADGSWQKVTVLTSYQIEALARAAAALSETELPLADLLLPLRLAHDGKSGYESRHGRVRINNRMRKGRAHTTITVQNGRETAYEAAFASQHDLTVQSRVAPAPPAA